MANLLVDFAMLYANNMVNICPFLLILRLIICIKSQIQVFVVSYVAIMNPMWHCQFVDAFLFGVTGEKTTNNVLRGKM